MKKAALARVLTGSFIAAAIALGGPAIAQEKKDERREIRSIIVKRGDKDGKPLILDGKELSEFRARCNGLDHAESDVRSGDGDKKVVTRVVICRDKGQGSAALRDGLVEALESVRGELGDRERMSAEHRADAIAALEREIARLKAQKD